jgi:hypothetical protein
MSNRIVALILAALAAGCGESGHLAGPSDGPSGDGPATPLPLAGRAVFAVDLDNRLLLFGSESPDTLARLVAVSGLGAGHRIVSIDFRGDSGGLYGVGTDGRLYSIDTLSGVATAAGPPIDPPLTGAHFGMTLEAGADRMRIHGVESDQNTVIDLSTGTLVSVDAPLAFGTLDLHAGQNPGIAGSAMRRSDGAIFGIEANADLLVRLVDPASGTLATVGPLGTGTTLCVGFDISEDGAAFAALTQSDGSKLHRIDLSTGTATPMGRIDVDSPIQGLAIVPGASAPPPRSARPPALGRRASFRPAVAPPACFETPGE